MSKKKQVSSSMYSKHILTDVGCRNIWENGKKTGYCVNIKINYYRGLPLSCIDQISLTVDEEDVDSNNIYLQHNGREYYYPDILKNDMTTDFYWIFGDLLRVVVKKEGGITQGIHNVKLVLGTRRSYTPTMVAVCEKKLTFA